MRRAYWTPDRESSGQTKELANRKDVAALPALRFAHSTEARVVGVKLGAREGDVWPAPSVPALRLQARAKCHGSAHDPRGEHRVRRGSGGS